MEPLGHLKHHQIEEGLQILKQMEPNIKHPSAQSKHNLVELSNKFYTIIPESFGRHAPPVIDSEELLKQQEARLHAMLQHAGQSSSTQFIWQFDSKHGWFDFEKGASLQLEKEYGAQQASGEGSHTVNIKSGQWDYQINLSKMTQTNIDHPNHRTRNIRRVPIEMSRPPTTM